MATRAADPEAAEQLLRAIAAEFQRAAEAEREYLDWRSTHPGAAFEAFSEAYLKWVEAGDAYARGYKLIEERYPSLTDHMLEIVAAGEAELARRTRESVV